MVKTGILKGVPNRFCQRPSLVKRAERQTRLKQERHDTDRVSEGGLKKFAKVLNENFSWADFQLFFARKFERPTVREESTTTTTTTTTTTMTTTTMASVQRSDWDSKFVAWAGALV